MLTVLGSGQQLRQDDPMALKDIVTLAQSRATAQADTMRYHYIS
jgi:nucleolar MIF4G domain-containing protein 1